MWFIVRKSVFRCITRKNSTKGVTNYSVLKIRNR